ncbi:hypothetical protein ACFV4T_27975 [Streptomyces sp. NPDC059755]|uniref:hypothetical protein n=1 Tax=Streptomyces sp. NPDC059755 TaxID=3346934 RepID=UPI003650D847
MKGTMTVGDAMTTAGHDGPDAEPVRDDASPQPSAPKPPREQGSWASENVPLIILALIVLVLGLVGLTSNDNVTCPGEATSCGSP